MDEESQNANRKRRQIRWLSIAVGVMWMLIAGWQEFLTFDSYEDSLKAARLQQRLANCQGNVAKRYDCKSSILIAEQRDKFIEWGTKSAIVFGPLIVLGLLYTYAYRRIDRKEFEERKRRNRERRRDSEWPT